MKEMIFEYKGKTYMAHPFIEFGVMYASFYEYFPNRIIFKKKYLETRMVRVRNDETLKESIMRAFDKITTSIAIEEIYQKKIEEYEKTT